MRIIYALFDPREPGHFRYVGKSTTTADLRLRSHIKEARKQQRKRIYKNCWIRKLLRDGVSPCICVLEKLQDADKVGHNTREVHWIAELRRHGHKLTNLTKGGDGGAAVGVPKTELHREAISKTLTGHAISVETREKISAGLRGRASTSGTKFKTGGTPWNKGLSGYSVERTKGIGWKHTDAAREKISKASAQRWRKRRATHVY